MPIHMFVFRENAGVPSQGISLHDLSTLPIDGQIKALMLNARVIHFRRLYELITCEKTEFSVLSELEKIAHLVRGTWIIKT